MKRHCSLITENSGKTRIVYVCSMDAAIATTHGDGYQWTVGGTGEQAYHATHALKSQFTLALT